MTPAKPPVILLVDDSENDVLLMRMALSEGARLNSVQIAANGEQAIA
ncbi:MAG: hypothetical protein L0Y58_11260 [Verrucomicrobia subdivision 3 bacterium]|nr:hypothetical protein [Limisphaerales bacterium]